MVTALRSFFINDWNPHRDPGSQNWSEDVRDSEDGSAPSLTSLDAPKHLSISPSEEMASDTPEDDQPTSWQRRLHGPRLTALLRTANSLGNSGDLALARRALRIRNCGIAPQMIQEDGVGIAITASRCRDRLCPTCGGFRAHEVKRRVLAAVSQSDSLRFLTLTMAHTTAPLEEQLDHLYASFRRLRSSRSWKARVRGGVAMVEVKLSEHDRCWHAHLHVLIDGSYYPQNTLSNDWRIASRGSTIVDIRAVSSRSQAAGYLGKYAAKPPGCDLWEVASLAEYAKASHGRRMLQSFGSMHRTAILEDTDRPSFTRRARFVPLRWITTALHYSPGLVAPSLLALAREGGWWRRYFGTYFALSELEEPNRDGDVETAVAVLEALVCLLDTDRDVVADGPPDTRGLVAHVRSSPEALRRFLESITLRLWEDDHSTIGDRSH